MTAYIKSIFTDFKNFAVKGNMVDMAVGIILGAAFNGVVNSIVKDLIMPPISLLLSKINFSGLFFTLKNGADTAGPYPSVEAAQNAGAVILNLGSFINNTISFLITAWAVFMLVKIISKLRSAPAPAAPNTKECPFCKSAININAVRCPNCTSEIH